MKQTVSRLLLVTAMFILCLPLAMAQAKWTVSGTVTDQNNEPLIGVSITSGKDAARIGATTDIDGKYTIVVPAGATINFAYVGYVPQDLKAVNGTLDVVLQEDNKTLDEVVVVGYGVQKKSSVTGAISQVKAEDIQNRTVVNPQSALQGKTAGVQIVSASNAPGSSPTVRVRGYSSNVSSDPLYVVDGVRLSDISGLDPNDIASIEVLKDAASAAIYGAEAGNGVVLISTKRGKAGQGKITYDFQYTSERVAKVPKMLNAEQYIEYMAEANTFTLDQMLLNWDGVTNTSWIDETFETGHMQRHNLSFTNGNERGNYYLSLSYMDNNGIIGGDADRYSRLTAAINAEYDIKDWLKVGTTNQIEKWNSRQVSSNNEYGSVLTSVLMLDPLTPFKYSPDNLPSHMVQALNSGKELLTDKDGNYYSVSRWQSAESYHPFTMRDNTVARQSGFNVNGSIFGEFKPVKGLVVTSRLGYRLSASRSSSVDLPFYGNATQSRDSLQRRTPLQYTTSGKTSPTTSRHSAKTLSTPWWVCRSRNRHTTIPRVASAPTPRTPSRNATRSSGTSTSALPPPPRAWAAKRPAPRSTPTSAAQATNTEAATTFRPHSVPMPPTSRSFPSPTAGVTSPPCRQAGHSLKKSSLKTFATKATST